MYALLYSDRDWMRIPYYLTIGQLQPVYQSIYLFPTISIQNKLFWCENKVFDNTASYFSLNLCLKGVYGYHLGEFNNTSAVGLGLKVFSRGGSLDIFMFNTNVGHSTLCIWMCNWRAAFYHMNNTRNELELYRRHRRDLAKMLSGSHTNTQNRR